MQPKDGKSHDVPQASPLDRRSFLKLGTMGALLPAVPSGKAVHPRTEVGSFAAQPASTERELLPGIPDLKNLASEEMIHEYHDYFSTPPAQNEWGYCQASKSVSGVAAILFPPYSCCGSPATRFTPGDLLTCELFLNGRLLSSYPGPDGRVAYTWYPHRIVREAHVRGFRVLTHTFLPSKQRAVAELIAVKNETRETRRISLGFDLRAGVTYKPGPWYVGDPAEMDNVLNPLESDGCILFKAQHSRAVSVQGIFPVVGHIERSRMIVQELELEPGEEKTLQYLNVIGDNETDTLDTYRKLQAGFRRLLSENEEVFSSQIRSAFTPGNSEFSGHLPQLITRDPVLWKLYYFGFADLFMSRRLSPNSVYGPTYLTVPRGISTLVFIWDTMLTSLGLSLLDPHALRTIVENWFVSQMDQHLATDYLTGKGMGPWYAVNDMGILRCAHDYLRVTGDYRWLEKSIEGKSVLGYLVDHALYWKQLDKYGHGLADYGTMDNLLECVSTWVHEVPAINAGNVYGMRFVATLLEHRGHSVRAQELRHEAKELAARINRLLYVSGKGWWKCGLPDGTFREVRHCYDLLVMLDMMFKDLSEQQKKEMAGFFWNELYTPLWMHALSPWDTDSTWNPEAFDGLRADHTWLGAYIAWPSMTAKGLYKINPPSRVSAWIRGLASATGQGPFGQAHLVETVFPGDVGGPLKSPGGGWYEVAGGNFMSLVIEAIFGLEPSLYNGIQAVPRLADFDPSAKLVNLNYQGNNYMISSEGAKRM